jgi:NAD+ synthase (glutamine-hydrolysing)
LDAYIRIRINVKRPVVEWKISGGRSHMSAVRIAIAQINVTVGDLRNNVEKIITWVKRATDDGADIVTFPELAVSGYPPEDLLIKPRFIEDCRLAITHLASKCQNITVMVGFPHFAEGHVYNAAALIQDGEIVDIYHKIELPNYGVFDEKRYFEPGKRCLLFEISGIRFTVTICEDLWVSGSVAEAHARDNGTDAVLNISASPFFSQKHADRLRIISRFASVTGTTVFYNNLIGGQDELVFDGGSLIIDHRGIVLGRAKRFEEDLLISDFQPSRSPFQLQTSPAGSQPHQPLKLVAMARPNREPISTTLSPQMDFLEEVYAALVLGTRDYVLKNGFRKVVIGLSGGIDSALTAVIAVEALGKENVTGVTMPSHYTSSETLSDAARLAKNLDIRLITVPIRDVFQSYMDTLKQPLGDAPPGIEAENLQARIRGNILMALSNRFGWLVFTTGNKSEIAVGYCTLYGDTAGGFAVIKDVPKTVVYELAEYINNRAAREVIPSSTILRPPTAELRPDQKDEDSLPPYGTLDPILKAYVEEDKAPDEIAREGFDQRIVEEVVRMVDRNEYKRRQAPPGVKITPKAFGRDRRLPITNRYPAGALFCADE